MMKKSKDNINKFVISCSNEMQNTLELLYNKKYLYFYNPPIIEKIIENKEEVYVITWPNHTGGRDNCGKAFTRLNQYNHLIENSSYMGILYDGSIIRSTYKFKVNKLIGHSHLWWPAPYLIEEGLTPHEMYESFITDPQWTNKLNMRSPIRIDYDPENNTKEHPAVHLHTQHHESRIHVDEPICFNRFIQYILKNFYPDIGIECDKWNRLNFTYDKIKSIDPLYTIEL